MTGAEIEAPQIVRSIVLSHAMLLIGMSSMILFYYTRVYWRTQAAIPLHIIGVSGGTISLVGYVIQDMIHRFDLGELSYRVVWAEATFAVITFALFIVLVYERRKWDELQGRRVTDTPAKKINE